MDGYARDDEDATVFVVRGDLASEVPKARLIYIDEEEDLKGFEILLTDSERMIGRDPGNSACIHSKKISRHHARIYPQHPDWIIEDLRSTNGVFVNDERITKAVLRHGDMVRLGPLGFRYLLDQAPVFPPSRPAGPAFDADHTHYLGDAGVIERLVQQEEEKNIPPKPPAYVPPVPEPQRPVVAPSRTRPLLWGILALVFLGGAVSLYGSLHDWRIGRQVENYTVNFRRFVGAAESDNLYSFQGELVEIRNLAIRVDETAKQYPATDCQGDFSTKTPECKLRDLQASVLFLAFERWLEALLEEGRTEHAARLVEETDDLIEKTRPKQGSGIYLDFERRLSALLSKPGGPANKPPDQQLHTVLNYVMFQPVPQELPGGDRGETGYVPTSGEVHELLKLAKIVVEFKQFRKEFPDPSMLGWRWPDRGRLSNLQDKKRELGDSIRARNVVLSGTYKYFKRLVREVDEKDSPLIDRWMSKSPAP